MTGGPADPAARFFDAIASRYDRVYAIPPAESRRRIERLLGELPPAPAHVLDLGVGTGRELSALLDAGHHPTGLDVSRAMLERCARRRRPVPLVQGDFWRPLPFGDASFNAAIALHGTLAHPPDDAALPGLARELARIVRHGGTWVVEVPSPAWLEAAATIPTSAGQRVTRTGSRTCLVEDTVVSVGLEATVYSDAEWREALAPAWTTNVDANGPYEWHIVARRA